MTAGSPSPVSRWFPYNVPEDASPEALRSMWPDELVLALEDVCMVIQRTATDEDTTVTDEDFEVLVDIRIRLSQEVHRRLTEAHRLAELNRRLLDGGGRLAHRRIGGGEVRTLGMTA